MIRRLFAKKIADIDHDLLQKNAYVVVRWAQNKFEGRDVVEHAIERMRTKFPQANKDDIEEAIHAMHLNMRIEIGDLK